MAQIFPDKIHDDRAEYRNFRHRIWQAHRNISPDQLSLDTACHGGKPENRQYGDTTPCLAVVFQGFLKQYMAKAAELMRWNVVDVVPQCEQDEQKNNEGTNLSLVSQPLRLGFTFTSGLTLPSILPCSFSNA